MSRKGEGIIRRIRLFDVLLVNSSVLLKSNFCDELLSKAIEEALKD